MKSFQESFAFIYNFCLFKSLLHCLVMNVFFKKRKKTETKKPTNQQINIKFPWDNTKEKENLFHQTFRGHGL